MTMKGVARKVFAALVFLYAISWLRVFLPPALRHTDVFHLARIAVEWQRFPVQQIYNDPVLKNITIPITTKHHGSGSSEYTPAWRSIPIDSNKIDSHFQPVMTSVEYQQTRLTFQTFIEACHWANLTYFLCAGTLLGAYRHHGMIPWDDDVDVIMNASEWLKIRHVLSRVPGFDVFAPSTNQWKFYMNDLPRIPEKGFKWPNIDIFFFTEDTDFIWGLTAEMKYHIYAKKSEVYPLQLRPFENVMAYVPCNMEEIILKQYSVSTCVSILYQHKFDRIAEEVISRPCKNFYASFPFVFRGPDSSGVIREFLKFDNRILRNTTAMKACN